MKTSFFAKALLTVFAAVLLCSQAAQAQQQEPPLPELLKNLAADGAQIRYLGAYNGTDGWIAIRQGKEQYFYMPSGGQSLMMGVLFDLDGKMVTARQVKELQEKSGGVMDLFAQQTPDDKTASSNLGAPGNIGSRLSELKTPSEQLFDNVTESNWIALGKPDAPVIYTFIDPQCPHCHDFINDLRGKGYLENGLVQVRAIPVGFREETKAQAALLLATPDPQDKLFRHLDGDKAALPVPPAGINEQGVERNMAIMQSWKLDMTPLTVYRSGNGKVKIVQGRAKDLPALIADLAKKIQ